MFNFSEIVSKVGIILQRSGDSDYLSKIKDWVNLAQQYAVNSYDYWSELQSEYTFSTTDGTEKYYLPSDFDKPFRLFDTTNHVKLTWITREEYYSGNIATIADAQTGIPNYAMLYGVNGVSRTISAETTAKVKSSSTSDNTGIIVRIEGWLDSAKTILGYDSITVSTSDPTSYTSGTVSFYGIVSCTKSTDTTGYITIADSSSNILATIAPYDRSSRYPVLYLGLIPEDTFSYVTLYKRKANRMVNDYDYPFMNCSDFLINYAVGYGLQQEKESESRATVFMKMANEQLALLMRNEMNKMGSDKVNKFTNLTAQSHRA